MTVDLLGFAGWLALCAGVWLLSPPWALIVGGTLMMALAVKLSMVPLKEEKPDDEADS